MTPWQKSRPGYVPGRKHKSNPTKQVVTLEDYTRPNSAEAVFFVLVDGIKRGILSKFRDDEFTTNPWKAFKMGCLGSTHPNHMLGVFYQKDGMERAMRAVVADAVGQPKHIVYPPRTPDVEANWARLGVQSR